jgi:hypothetical protein
MSEQRVSHTIPAMLYIIATLPFSILGIVSKLCWSGVHIGWSLGQDFINWL